MTSNAARDILDSAARASALTADDLEWHRFTMSTLSDLAGDPRYAAAARAEIDRRDRDDIRRIR